MTETALAFLGVSALVIATPGQDTALTIRNALAGGRRGGVFTALGVAAGQATWTLAAAAGIATLLRASEPLFLAVRLFGAAYLVVLGGQSLLAALRRRGHGREIVGHRASAAGSFRQGLVSNLGNPKMAVFFTSPARTRSRLLHDDVRLVERLRHRRREGRRHPAPAANPPYPRSRYGNGARRARRADRGRELGRRVKRSEAAERRLALVRSAHGRERLLLEGEIRAERFPRDDLAVVDGDDAAER